MSVQFQPRLNMCGDGLRMQSVTTSIRTGDIVRDDLVSKLNPTTALQGDGKLDTNLSDLSGIVEPT